MEESPANRRDQHVPVLTNTQTPSGGQSPHWACPRGNVVPSGTSRVVALKCELSWGCHLLPLKGGVTLLGSGTPLTPELSGTRLAFPTCVAPSQPR